MTDHGCVKNTGSSNVTIHSMPSAAARRKRSVSRSLSLCSWPAVSSHVRSLIATVSTTSVTPSHRAVENPIHSGFSAMSGGGLRPSV